MATKAIHQKKTAKDNPKKSHKTKSLSGEKKKRGVSFIDFMKEKTKELGEIDYTFLLLAVVLTVLGLIMLLSASTPAANVKTGRSYFFFNRQLAFVLLGFVAMYVCSIIDYRNYKKFANIGIIVGIVLLCLVLIPHVGVERNGSRRWINLGFVDFQPSELVKFLVAVFFASTIEDKRYSLDRFDGLLKYGAWLVAIVGPILLETHLSGAIVVGGIAVCILIVGGMSMKYVWLGLAGAGGLGTLLVFVMPSRMARITSFLHPFEDPQGKGYQIIQSLYAIGSGGIFGRGLGQSMQKYSFLPEPYNDFIFAVISEELGLVGSIFIMLIFAGLIIRGISIALKARDTFGMLLTIGIVSQIAIQTILNIAVVTSSVPNTGVTLPFFSYGGTAISILLAEIGVILNVSRNSKNRL